MSSEDVHSGPLQIHQRGQQSPLQLFRALQNKRQSLLVLYSGVLLLPVIHAEAETPMLLCEKMPYGSPQQGSRRRSWTHAPDSSRSTPQGLLTQIVTKQRSSQRAPPSEGGESQVTVSHTIRMVKGVSLLDMGNVESSTPVIPNMIIAHSLCVRVAY